MSCAARPCFSSSDKCLFCWAAFFPSACWRMPEMSRAFVHGHTFLHSWSGPMKLVVCLLHVATFLSNLISAPFVPGQGLGHQNNMLSPQSSVNREPCSNHMQVTEAQSLCKCKVTGRLFGTGGFYRYLVRASGR